MARSIGAHSGLASLSRLSSRLIATMFSAMPDACTGRFAKLA